MAPRRPGSGNRSRANYVLRYEGKTGIESANTKARSIKLTPRGRRNVGEGTDLQQMRGREILAKPEWHRLVTSWLKLGFWLRNKRDAADSRGRGTMTKVVTQRVPGQ